MNLRLSGLRMESSECIYGMLKRRWPIIKGMRTTLNNAMQISLAVCILHNISVRWGMPDPPGDEQEDGMDDEEGLILEEDLEVAEVRAQADTLRNRLKDNMPPATPAEVRKMRENN